MGHRPVEKPPVLSVVAAQPVFRAEGLPGIKTVNVNLQTTSTVIRMHILGPAVALLLLHRPACEIEPDLIEVVAELVGAGGPDEHGCRIGQSGESLFTFLLGPFAIGDFPSDYGHANGLTLAIQARCHRRIIPTTCVFGIATTRSALCQYPLHECLIYGTALGRQMRPKQRSFQLLQWLTQAVCYMLVQIKDASVWSEQQCQAESISRQSAGEGEIAAQAIHLACCWLRHKTSQRRAEARILCCLMQPVIGGYRDSSLRLYRGPRASLMMMVGAAAIDCSTGRGDLDGCQRPGV